MDKLRNDCELGHGVREKGDRRRSCGQLPRTPTPAASRKYSVQLDKFQVMISNVGVTPAREIGMCARSYFALEGLYVTCGDETSKQGRVSPGEPIKLTAALCSKPVPTLLKWTARDPSGKSDTSIQLAALRVLVSIVFRDLSVGY